MSHKTWTMDWLQREIDTWNKEIKALLKSDKLDLENQLRSVNILKRRIIVNEFKIKALRNNNPILGTAEPAFSKIINKEKRED